MSDGPKQLIVFPGTEIASRSAVMTVTSEAGEHVGPAFPKDANEGNMLPFQETFGSFAEAEIDYRLLRSGGIGSATWGWKLSTDDDDQWRGQGDIRFQTGVHDPFRAIAGREALGADGHCIIVSKVHNRLLVIRRRQASTDNGSVMIAYRDIGATQKQKYTDFVFQPSNYFESAPKCQMKHVGGCELPDGTLRMVANNSDPDGRHDLVLFGSSDGGLTWTLLQENIIDRWFNQKDKVLFPTDVRGFHQLRVASSGDWIRIVWYGNDGYLHTMLSSDRGATWENLQRTTFKGHYQPHITETMLDECRASTVFEASGGTYSPSAAWNGYTDASVAHDGHIDNITNHVADHVEHPIKSMFDLVGLGGSDGNFALIAHPRMSAESSKCGGLDPTRNIIMLSGVRDSDWAIARGIPSPVEPSVTSGPAADGRGRPLIQSCGGYQQVTACATPFWLYVMVFVAPNTALGEGTTSGHPAGFADFGGTSEGVGGGKGYTRNLGASGYEQPAPGAWSITSQYCGWIGWRVPISNPFGGSLQTMHGNTETGYAFPVSSGQGKMFAPFNVRTAWAGDRIIMLHGATYNGAFDSVRNGEGLYGSIEGATDNNIRHAFQAVAAGWASTAAVDGTYPAIEDGYMRRGSTIDNPVRYVGGVAQSQYSTGRAWSCVTWWGGWDQQPISDPDGTTIGMDTLNPMMGDTWSCQYGIPHLNPAGNRPNNYFADLTSFDNGGCNRFFNIIGPGTPVGEYDISGHPVDFLDTAQSIMTGQDTRNQGRQVRGANAGASSSFWSAKMDLNPAGALTSASDWTQYNRRLGEKALDWEMDHVSFRLNFFNPRSGTTGGGTSSFHYFSSNSGLDLNGFSRFDSYAYGAAAGGFQVMPDRFSPVKGCNIWGAPIGFDVLPVPILTGVTTKELGRFTSLGNTSMITWVASVPHQGLRKGAGVSNWNTPLSRVGGGSGWRFAAMQVTPFLERGGIHSGGNFYIGDVCVAMGTDGNNDVAVLVDQLDGTEVTRDSITLRSDSLGSGFGSVEDPIFWEFRLTMYRNNSNELRARLWARRVGIDEEWQKTSTCTMDTRIVTGSQSNLRYDEQQTAAWGIIDATPATDHEYVAHWREFNVSYYGCGSRWNMGTMDNPAELPGLVCAPTPVYVTNNIYARWGGGGGFIGDQFTGTIDHSYAVENIFTPSPYTKWKTDSSSGSSTHPMAYDSIAFSVDPVTAASPTAAFNQQRSAATWLALYGVQDRSIFVDVSYKRDFRADQTVTYKASSLLTTITISSVNDNVITYVDGYAGPNHGAFKEGALAGKYIGWQAPGPGYTSSHTAKILTNRYAGSADPQHGLIWIDPLSLSPGMSIHEDSLSSDYGLGSGPGITADLWSDRCAIDLLSDDSRVAGPALYGSTVWRRGFSFLRLRFAGDGGSPVGTIPAGSALFGTAGYHTIDGKHTVGTMILGRGVNFDVPLNWEHGDGTTPNVKIETAPSGQKQSYKMSPPRRSVSFNMPGDINSFRYRLQNLLEEYTSYTQKPVALLLQTDSSTTLADDRFNILARYSGSFENANVGWKRDENNVWVPIGDTTLKFDEEL